LRPCNTTLGPAAGPTYTVPVLLRCWRHQCW